LQEKVGAEKNLKAWTQSWIEKAGANEIEPIIESEGSKFTVYMQQSVPKHGDPVLRD
jgi:hypothetical protein